MAEHTDPASGAQETVDPSDVVVQLLRVLSQVDLDGLGEDLSRLDGAAARQALTGASLLAEAVTRAALGSDTLADALGADFGDPGTHQGHRSRGIRIDVHDDEGSADLSSMSEA